MDTRGLFSSPAVADEFDEEVNSIKREHEGGTEKQTGDATHKQRASTGRTAFIENKKRGDD